jgi:hypothetical protein
MLRAQPGLKLSLKWSATGNLPAKSGHSAPLIEQSNSSDSGGRKMKNRRSKLAVDPTVQWAIVRRVLCHWVYFLVMTAVVLPVWIAVMSWDIVDKSFTFEEAVVTGCGRALPLIVFFIAIAPIIVYDVLKMSNRFVGPVYRLRKAIKDLAAGGETPPIQLRKDDFWKDVIADFNALAEQVASLRKRETPSATLEPATCGAPEAEAR